MNVKLESKTVTVTIASGAAESDPIDFTNFSKGVLHMPGTWTAASIGFKVRSGEASTYQPLYDTSGNLVQISGPAAGGSYVLPAELAGVRFFKLWSQSGAGVDVNQAADREIYVDKKV